MLAISLLYSQISRSGITKIGKMALLFLMNMNTQVTITIDGCQLMSSKK